MTAAVKSVDPLFEQYRLAADEQTALDRDGHLVLPGILTDSARNELVSALEQMLPYGSALGGPHMYAAEHVPYLATLITHPQPSRGTLLGAMELDEPVHLVACDPAWPGRAEVEMQRIGQALGAALVACEHFGSTSVPGCEAKPIIDILVGLGVWPAPAHVRRALCALGYEDCGEAGIPGRLYFRARGEQAFNLAVTRAGSELWSSNLRVRELLRTDPELVRAYVEVKRHSVSAGGTTLLAYSRHKAEFMAELVRRASGRRL